MTESYGYTLGQFRGREFFIHVSASPSLASAKSFAVIVYFRRLPGENVEIARVDTAHGYTHFDRLYRRDQPKSQLTGIGRKQNGIFGIVGDALPNDTRIHTDCDHDSAAGVRDVAERLERKRGPALIQFSTDSNVQDQIISATTRPRLSWTVTNID